MSEPLLTGGNWCVKCGAYQHEAPKPECKNPSWHDLPAPAEDEKEEEAA